MNADEELGDFFFKDVDGAMQRLVKFADEYPISHIINMHNEMTMIPKVEYPNIVIPTTRGSWCLSSLPSCR